MKRYNDRDDEYESVKYVEWKQKEVPCPHTERETIEKLDFSANHIVVVRCKKCWQVFSSQRKEPLTEREINR